MTALHDIAPRLAKARDQHLAEAERWVEVRLNLSARVADFYAWLDDPDLACHHFWDERWWPGGWVVRIPGPERNLDDCPYVNHVRAWDPSEDVELYGERWLLAQQFFAAGSRLAVGIADLPVTYRDWYFKKLVHCFLNANGLSCKEEIDFADEYSEYLCKVIEGVRLDHLKSARRWVKPQVALPTVLYRRGTREASG